MGYVCVGSIGFIQGVHAESHLVKQYQPFSRKSTKTAVHLTEVCVLRLTSVNRADGVTIQNCIIQR
jgi:hypothetical protein